MNLDNPFTSLALQVQRGIPGAARRYRAEVKPEYEWTVRDLLEREPISDWEEGIRVEIGRVLSRSRGFLTRDSEDLPGVVAERLCDRAIDNLQSRGRKLRPALPAGARETVLC